MKSKMGDAEGQAADIRRAVDIFQGILRGSPDDEATLQNSLPHSVAAPGWTINSRRYKSADG